MKKNQLKLKALNVQSFITAETLDLRTVKGGSFVCNLDLTEGTCDSIHNTGCTTGTSTMTFHNTPTISATINETINNSGVFNC